MFLLLFLRMYHQLEDRRHQPQFRLRVHQVGGASPPAKVPPASQLSVQDRLTIGGTLARHSTVTAAGGAAIKGGVLSSTVIIGVTCIAGLPQASETFHFLVIAPPHVPPVRGPPTPATVPPASQLS